MQASFIADVHLGRLARLLRLLGFDTLYRNDLTKRELVAIAQSQNRFLLSRDAALATNPVIRFLWVEKEDAYEQTKQVVRQLQLKDRLQPFSRCMACNGTLQAVPKEEILEQLEENTINYYNTFWQCAGCRRIYWKGSHYERMQTLLAQLNDS